MALFPGVKSHEKSCVLGFGGTTLAPETGSVMPELLDMLIDRILGSLCSPCILFSVYGGIPHSTHGLQNSFESSRGLDGFLFTSTVSIYSEHLAVSPPYAKTLSFLGFFFPLREKEVVSWRF